MEIIFSINILILLINLSLLCFQVDKLTDKQISTTIDNVVRKITKRDRVIVQRVKTKRELNLESKRKNEPLFKEAEDLLLSPLDNYRN